MAMKRLFTENEQYLGHVGCSAEKEKRADSLQQKELVDFSVIIPICERYDDIQTLYAEYASQLENTGKSYEFLFIVDGDFGKAFEQLKVLKARHSDMRVIKFRQNLGESVALSAGFERATGRSILTLPSYHQVEPNEVGKVIAHMEEGYDLVVTRRYPRIDSLFNRLQSLAFHWLTRKLTGMEFHDISCGLRGMTRKVLKKIDIYGDLHRFIPLLAYRLGFNVAEVEVRQSPLDSSARIYGPGVYLRRLLDIATVFFLLKFTRKPLRFFGLIGLTLVGSGGLITAYLGIYRILGYGSIADRPLLLLGVLLMVLGMQTASIGLIGEIIIFTHARRLREYRIDKLLK